jgi:hypothetical protein
MPKKVNWYTDLELRKECERIKGEYEKRGYNISLAEASKIAAERSKRGIIDIKETWDLLRKG